MKYEKTIGVRMDYITVKQIDALSALAGQSASQVVRTLIKKALEGTIIKEETENESMTTPETKQTEEQGKELLALAVIIDELERTRYAVEAAEDRAEEALGYAEKWCKNNNCDATDNMRCQGSTYASVLEDVGSELEEVKRKLEDKV